MHTRTATRQSATRFQSLPSGFSLTELLVVIGIIVLLVGLLLVALGQVQKQAQRTQTESRMQQFANACTAFQAEHGFYPGVIPDHVLRDHEVDTGSPPPISGTENALLHLLGGYRVLSPADDTTPDSPAEIKYAEFVSSGGAAVQTTTFTSASGEWTLAVNRTKLGEGPVINGKPFAPYFTPGKDDLASIKGQINASGALECCGEEDCREEDLCLPDLVDAWGQPIIYLKQSRTRGPLRPDPTSPGAAEQFLLGGVSAYLESTALGEMNRDQVAGSILNYGTDVQKNQAWALVLSNQAFYKPPPPDENPLKSAARGAFALFSAGPDGIYFSKADGPGSEADPIDEDVLFLEDFIEVGPRVLDEFDDVRIFGGG